MELRKKIKLKIMGIVQFNFRFSGLFLTRVGRGNVNYSYKTL